MTLIPLEPLRSRLAQPLLPPAPARLRSTGWSLSTGPVPQARVVPETVGGTGRKLRHASGATCGARCRNPESDGRHGVYLLSAPPAAVISPVTPGEPLDAPPWTDREAGMATAEYAIATLAAVAFAGLLAVVLSSDEVRSMLVSLIRSALTLG